MTIGFNAVSSLAAGKVDAATGFWNAEGVTLRRQGVPIRIFKVDRLRRSALPGADPDHLPRRRSTSDPELVDAMVDATRRGYAFTEKHPAEALGDLLAADPALERADQAAQLKVLLPDLHPSRSTSRSPRMGGLGPRTRPAWRPST